MNAERTTIKTLATTIALVAIGLLASNADAGIVESATAPTTDIIASADRANDKDSALTTLFRNGAGVNQEQHVGQSFQFAGEFSIDAVTIQYSTPVSGGAESFTYAAGQTLRLNITEDTDNDGTPDSVVSFEDFSVAGLTAQNFEYWTFDLTTPVTGLDANTVHGFMFEFLGVDGSNIFRVETVGADTYSDGGQMFQFNPTSLFPTPGTDDITFYLQGNVVPTPASLPAGLALISFAAMRRRR